jgi:hypothetical protein
MAVSTSTITSFAAIGVPGSCSEFDIYESTTNPKRPLGYKIEDVQGNIYRWAHFGATTTQGKVVSQDIDESSYVDTDNVIVAPASAVTVSDGTIGSRFIEITLASITADQFAGGKIVITDDTGEGYTYGIIGNTATGDPATLTFRVELASPLQVAVSSDSDFAIVGNMYGNVEPATSTDFAIVGVSMGSQAAADYGWVLTKGTVGILSDGNIGQIGKGIAIGTVAGSVIVATATNDNVFGYCIAAPDNTGYGMFKINCE